MSDIKSIARMMKALEKDCEPCTRCGMCQAHCPVYHRTGREADAARGKVALIEGLIDEIITDAHGVYGRISKCLLCGSCSAKCPRGVKTNEIIIKARAILMAYLGLPFYKKILFRKIVSHPERFDRIFNILSKHQHVLIDKEDPLTGVSCARYNTPLLSERHFKPLATRSFQNRIQKSPLKPCGKRGTSSSSRVFFFVGCLIDKFFPEVAEASVSALEHHQFDICIPENQACCGIPSLSEGDLSSFKDLVRHSIERFPLAENDYLVTACATCTFTIKRLWPLMFEGARPSLQKKIEHMADRTLDISELIHREIISAPVSVAKKHGEPPPVTWHAPCHLSKSLGIKEEPISLIKANPDYRFVEMADSDVCCGLGGSFNLKHYDISVEIGMKKRDNIVSSGARVVATACPACMIQLADMLSKKGDNISVKHAIEIYAETFSKE